MNNILSKIVANTKRELIIRKLLVSQTFMESELQSSSRSLFDALSNKKSDFIFECKKASPSKGLIRRNFDLAEILASYSKYASAISVLTDHKYFKGSFAHLQFVSENVQQPVLCKDFFIDPYQLIEARYHGADAILLMLSVLDDSEYIELARKAQELNLDVLTEVHDKVELDRALKLGAKIIGVNNRNLKDLSIDLNTTIELISSLPNSLKKGRLFISESGISDNREVRKISPYVNGFLVGSSIMRMDNISKQCKSLIYGKNKICGLTKRQSATCASEQGAIFGGLIFSPKSIRYVTPKVAKRIMAGVDLDFVGVFVDEPFESLIRIAKELGLSIIQLHGNEDAQYVRRLKSELSDCVIWKAISIENNSSLEQSSLLDCTEIDQFLLDTKHQGSSGGTGKTFDWKILEQLSNSNIILAGGLKLENIKKASELNTYALDINSGVEETPGEKSCEKITQLFNVLQA